MAVKWLCSVIKRGREDRFRTSCWCFLGDSGDRTVRLAVRSREKIVAQASLGERSELAGGKTKGVRVLTKGQRDKIPESSGNTDRVGFRNRRVSWSDKRG